MKKRISALRLALARTSCPIFIPSTRRHWPWTSAVGKERKLIFLEEAETRKSQGTGQAQTPLLFPHCIKETLKHIFPYNIKF